MVNDIEIYPEDVGSKYYSFNKIPAAEYILHLAYAGFSDEIKIKVPEIGETTNVKFNANYDLSVELFDSFGNPISDDDKMPFLEGKILRLCTGKTPLEEIYKQVEVPKLKVLEILNKYQKRGYLKFITVLE